eukprot:4941391-Pyramimonas_sp.AAC.1
MPIEYGLQTSAHPNPAGVFVGYNGNFTGDSLAFVGNTALNGGPAVYIEFGRAVLVGTSASNNTIMSAAVTSSRAAVFLKMPAGGLQVLPE